jgi:hypothetical protein
MNSETEKNLQIKAFDEICDCIFNDDKTVEAHANNMKHIYGSLFDTKESNLDLMKAMNAFKIAFDKNPNETIKKILENQIFRKSFAEVFTPDFLINEMTKKLPKFVWKNPNLKWLDNSCGSGNFLVFIKNKLMKTLSDAIPDKDAREKHILENMLYGIDIQAKNIVIASFRLDNQSQFDLNLVQHDALTHDYWNTKFDIVVGNPPYDASQNNQGKRGGGDSLWDKFVIKALDNLIEDGYLCYVHPTGWRKPQTEKSSNKKINEVMFSKQILYLNMNNTEDGKRVFDAGTRFDFYVIQNSSANRATVVVDEENVTTKINLANRKFLPNKNFDLIEKLYAKNGEATLNVIFNVSNYETRKDWVSETEDATFCYPLVHTTPRDGVRYRYSSRNDNGHFGISKVIFGDSGIHDCIIDLDGNYGMTQHSIALEVESLEEAENFKKALTSSKFSDFLESMMWSNYQIDWRIFLNMKKDFWTEFV